MDFDSLSKEQQIMVAMRKTLASIIKDTTPDHPGMVHPLSEATVNDIKACFALIAAREKELLEAMGIENKARPHYTDEVNKSAEVVKFHKPK